MVQLETPIKIKLEKTDKAVDTGKMHHTWPCKPTGAVQY